MVRPTSRGWCIAANAVIWLCISQVNHNLMALFLACASLAVLIVSFIASLFTLRGIEIVRRPFDKLYVGSLANLPLECRNRKVAAIREEVKKKMVRFGSDNRY